MIKFPDIAYLILAHGDPDHLAKLVRSLQTEQAIFFIHIDKKTDIEQFASLEKEPSVHFCAERFNCAWGDFSLVEATLALIKASFLHNSGVKRFVLLSGSCFPVQPAEYIEQFFHLHSADEFIDCFQFPNSVYGKNLLRIDHYWMRRNLPTFALRLKLHRLQGILQDFILKKLPERDHSEAFRGLKLCTGSQWWALTRDAAAYVLETPRRNREFYQFVKNTDCPDEFFFQTVLANSPFQGRLRHSLTYANWQPNATGPEAVSTKHLEELNRSIVGGALQSNCPNPPPEVLFARKFSSASNEIVEAVIRGNRAKAKNLLGTPDRNL